MTTLIQPLLEEKEMEAIRRILDYLGDEEESYAATPPAERKNHIYRSVLVLRASGLITSDTLSSLQTCSTPGAIAAMADSMQEPAEFLTRHFSRDWGDVDADDWKENNWSLENGCRLLSSYRTNAGERLWIITEADRSVTTILLPEEY
jgi:hypothetical protein